jgi:hypothetical protein
LEEGIFFEPDVHEHRLDPGLDVADLALVDAPDDVAVGLALDRVFLELEVLEERDPFFESLAADDELDACGFFLESQNAFYGVYHVKLFVVGACCHAVVRLFSGGVAEGVSAGGFRRRPSPFSRRGN